MPSFKISDESPLLSIQEIALHKSKDVIVSESKESKSKKLSGVLEALGARMRNDYDLAIVAFVTGGTFGLILLIILQALGIGND